MTEYVKTLEDAVEKYQQQVSDMEKKLESYSNVDFLFVYKCHKTQKYAGGVSKIMHVTMQMGIKTHVRYLDIMYMKRGNKMWEYGAKSKYEEPGLIEIQLKDENIDYYVKFLFSLCGMGVVPYTTKEIK